MSIEEENPESFEKALTKDEMDKEALYMQRKKHKVLTAAVNSCCHWALIIAIIVILVSHWGDECDQPIRAWLIVYAAFSGFGTSFALLFELIIHEKLLERVWVHILYVSFYTLSILFFITWLILGTIWIWWDDSCQEKFWTAWALTIAILAVQYFMLIVCGCSGLFAVIMVVCLGKGRIIIKKKSLTQNSES
ncbi:unnamed protein product [Blepharisma stoltei]|uniref:Transmembrane protein n=1 Tax=Blepharisma stoltei TaxID=1481888 RepID=A0AAU9K9X3_9CILI|nr:unnamed protein product [Blepharisma stoltei]